MTDAVRAYVQAVVDAAPPITDAQRNRIAAVLRSTPERSQAISAASLSSTGEA